MREAAPDATAAGSRCAWCGHPLDATARREGRIAVCAACGTGTTDPPPTAAELDAAYAGWYRPAAGRFAGVGDRLLQHSRGTLARRLDRRAPTGPVLDVGSGDGALLDALHRIGRRATGLERESTRPDVLAASLSEIEGDWAAIVFWHSLEHLTDPGQALAAAAERLRAGGLLVVAAPNFASLQAALFGADWFAADVPRHLVHLRADLMVVRMRDLGLRVERVSHLRGGQVVFGWLHGLVGALPGHPSLYDAIRRPEARSAPVARGRRLTTLATAALLSPLAAAAAAVEAGARRGGSIYVEARRASGGGSAEAAG
jgi:SAM-dependent methyltransferase